MNKLALYCRAGFEKEVAGEINDKAAQLGIFGFANVKENSGYVIFECYQAGEADRLAKELAFNQLIFVRQMIVVGDLLQDLPEGDRISPILAQYQTLNPKNSSEIFVETPVFCLWDRVNAMWVMPIIITVHHFLWAYLA